MQSPFTCICMSPVLLSLAFCTSADGEEDAKPRQTPAVRQADVDSDFAFQGEFAGSIQTDRGKLPYGVQVIALGDGEFEAVGYRGGLPGAGWNPTDDPQRTKGTLEGGTPVFRAENARATITKDTLIVRDLDGNELGQLEKVHRKSPTLGLKPPEAAIVLFDGTSAENFRDGRITDDGLLMEGAMSRHTFQDCTLHLEFLLSYMPYARGQGRSNSGCYLQGRYEVQILDSFGLAGEDNECGGIYGVKAPRINMCFPPLSWQTYDVDFNAARFDEDGKKTEDARMAVKHNGVLIHDDVAIPRATRAAPLAEAPQPGPLYLQNHGNPLRFRNIWMIEKE